MALAKSFSSDAGFSLAEVAVATGILAAVSLGVAQMFALSTGKNLQARQQVSTTTLATQKMEQLRGLTFSYDSGGSGLPVTDTTTNLTKCTSDTSGVGLNPSPSDALEKNESGYVDFLDGQGNCVSTTGTTTPAGAIYTRRWSIVPLPTNPNNALVLTVLVTPSAREDHRGASSYGRTRFPEDSMLITVLSRKAP